MSCFLLCFKLLTSPIHLLSVRSPPEGGHLVSSLWQLSHIHKTPLWLCDDNRSQFAKTCVSICAVSQTLLGGAIRSKIKIKEESQTCSFSYCDLFLFGLFHSPTVLQSLLVYVFNWAHLCTIHCLFSGRDTFIFVFKDLLSLFSSYLLLLLTLETCTPGATFTRKG